MGEKNKDVKQTRSRSAAAKPAVRAKLVQLKRNWKSRTWEQRAGAVEELASEGMSNYGIGEALGLSEAAIRRYRSGPRPKELARSSNPTEKGSQDLIQNARSVSNLPTREKNPGGREKSRRLAAVIVSFLQGRNGAPTIRSKDVTDLVTQAQVRFSCARYDPVRQFLPEKASVAEIIRRTKPKPVPAPFTEWELGYQADWLASIMISMCEDRNVRARALEYVGKKINLRWQPPEPLIRRSTLDPRRDPNWDKWNPHEQQIQLWRWLQS